MEKSQIYSGDSPCFCNVRKILNEATREVASLYLLFVFLVRNSFSHWNSWQKQDDKSRKHRRQNCYPLDSFDDVQRYHENPPPKDDFTEIVWMSADLPQTYKRYIGLSMTTDFYDSEMMFARNPIECRGAKGNRKDNEKFTTIVAWLPNPHLAETFHLAFSVCLVEIGLL